MIVLRASSLAAVMILVWSTRLRPSWEANSRTRLVTATTSGSVLTGTLSEETTAIHLLVRVDRGSQQLHARVHIQRCAHSRQRKPQLYQSDCHRRLHTHDHGFRIQHARHRRDIAQHPPDEGVYDFER